MKRLSLLFCILMAISLLCGCSSDLSESEYLGKWTAKTYDYTQSDMIVADSMGEYSITLKGDGTYSAVFGDVVEAGVWEETSDGVMLENSAHTRLHKEDDGSLSLIYEDDMIVYFLPEVD